jgi:glyoxylase-like metal-dependent hydrolase (beta-lactamase superfamily II)
MEIAKNIYHFATPPFNWYLIRESGQLTIVDSGFPGHYATLLSGLQSIGHSPIDVAAIVITHAHADHMGFASRLSQVSGAPIYIHAADQAAARHILELPWLGLLSNTWRTWGRGILLNAIANGILRMTRIPDSIPVQHGAKLDIPGQPTVIHVPGHTKGEIALYIEDSSTLISGDCLITQSLTTGKMGFPQLANPSLEWNHEQSKHSLQSLSHLGNVRILPGHGNPWDGRIESAIESALNPSNS